MNELDEENTRLMKQMAELGMKMIEAQFPFEGRESENPISNEELLHMIDLEGIDIHEAFLGLYKIYLLVTFNHGIPVWGFLKHVADVNDPD